MPEPCKLVEGEPCAFCRELEEFDVKYQAILEGLAEQRRNILQRINEHHDPFIQRLPLELASQIFVSCLPQHVFDSDPAHVSLLWDALKMSHIKPFNIVLGSICQSWRRIAWSTPNLWSTLPIRLHLCDTKTQMELTLEWLGRSAQIPLDVAVAYSEAYDHEIETSEELTEENAGLWKPLIDIVNGCSSRWRTFVVDVPELVYPYIVGNGKPTSILEGLKVGPAFSFRRFPTGLSLTNTLPMPSELVSSTVPLRLIGIGWSNLTIVRINGLYINECLVLLTWAPRLITFEINKLEPGQDEILPSPAPITHNRLECLDIFGLAEKETAQELLDFLILPSLVDLLYDSSYNPLDNISAFLQRSCCRLTGLRILNYDSDHFFEMAPVSGLQALKSLEYYGYLDGCLRCLNRPTNGGDSSIFLPNLHKLTIWDEPGNWSGLLDLFLSRPLTTLSVHLTHSTGETASIDKETALRLRDLVEKGHDITIMGRLLGDGQIRDLLPWFIEVLMSEKRMGD